jgi:hypothetical protein
MPSGMRTDVHQHLLPEPLVIALARRRRAPRIVRDGGGWSLELVGEPATPFRPADHDPLRRARLAERDGIERVLVSLSTALGLEALPAEESAPLLALFNDGVLELGAPFALWAAVARGVEDADASLDAGALGVALPAGALAGPRELARLAPLLERLEARSAPVFVHPGPAAVARPAPAWWPAMTSYVADMNAAWHGFAAWGRPRHPDLRIVYAMLAGGAPLHAERLAARGGPAEAVHDPRAWFDVSSYGARAIDAMIRVVGVDRLVHGSDRPVAEPPAPGLLGEAVEHALAVANPQRALGAVGVPA